MIFRNLFLVLGLTSAAVAQNIQPKDETPLKAEPKHAISASGEFLWWKAKQTGMPYAVTCDFAPLTGSFPAPYGYYTNLRLREVPFPHDPGYRISINYKPPFDGWDLGVIWTTLLSKGSDSIALPYDPNSPGYSVTDPWNFFAPPTFTGTPIIFFPTEGSAVSWIRSKIFDFDLGKMIRPAGYFSFRPFIGYRYAHMNQIFKSEFNDGNFDQTSGVLMSPAAIAKISHSFLHKGIGQGLRAGIDFMWNLPLGFSLYGKGAISLLWEKYMLRHKEDVIWVDLNIAPFTRFDSFASNLKPRSVKTVCDLSVGAEWVSRYFQKRYRFRFFGGYDFSYWPSQPQFLSSPVINSYYNSSTALEISDTRDLSFMGFNGGAGMDF